MELCQLVILYRHELFAKGLASLLRSHGFQVVPLDERSKDAFPRLQAMRPRVILVEDNDTDRAFATKLREILRRNPEVGVIRINVENNRLSIYCASQVTATGPQDLFDAVERLAGLPFKGRPSGQQPAFS